MTKLRVCRSALLILANCVLASCLAAGGLAYGQAYYPNKEVRISDLASLTARSPSAADVLATSVEIVFHDKEVCCGKLSALEDGIQSADPTSLKDVGDKLRGRHLRSDGLPIQVAAEYLPAASVNADPPMPARSTRMTRCSCAPNASATRCAAPSIGRHACSRGGIGCRSGRTSSPGGWGGCSGSEPNADCALTDPHLVAGACGGGRTGLGPFGGGCAR